MPSDPSVMPDDATSTVVALIAVYDADGTVIGELSYWIGARLGRAHCSFCEITHGWVRAKPEWTACRERLGVRFDTYHRNDMPAAVRAAIGDRLPVVVAEIGGGAIVPLLGPDELVECAGSLDAMLEQLANAAAVAGLDLDLTPSTA